jgi:hypothetical protein
MVKSKARRRNAGPFPKPTLSAYVDRIYLLFLKIAYKPRTALKIGRFLVVPVNIPSARTSAKLAKFEPVSDIPVFSGPFCPRLKKNYGCF